MGVHSLRPTWLQLLLNEVCQQRRPTLSPQYDTIPWWQVDYTGLPPSWKGQHFFFPTKADTLYPDHSGYRFAYTVHNASVSRLTECLIHNHGILNSIASDQGTPITVIEVQQQAHPHRIHWSSQVPHHSEAAGLTDGIMF